MQRRQQDGTPTNDAPVVSTTPQMGDASQIDLDAWEEQTSAACENALQSLNGEASNPSGMAVCYNLPFLDNETGVFQAELRVYNVSAPIPPWTGVSTQDITVALSYLGATVQNVNGTLQRRDALSWPSDDKLGELVRKQAASMDEVKVLTYVGQVNSNLMGSAMSNEQLQPLLIPSIVLAATAPDSGEIINTTLSSTEASFVNGVFADQATQTLTPESQISASQAAATATPFVLPGTTFGIFPTGFIVTMIWSVAFVVTVGLGTMGRIQFRDQYRRRVKREVAIGVANF
ncbi:hypothetical protein BDY21DRAFT_287294 [Lineolata rhizophorae]|uniref:Uncharacterized protein n=1 Tax=Lineolata rhizophorae TaxID=578093 RepID=A0A6A6NZ20_9PEZI|nr:hypothetical protein BDY21DRAFT_287294 [Lineolata rhizophorae]